MTVKDCTELRSAAPNGKGPTARYGHRGRLGNGLMEATTYESLVYLLLVFVFKDPSVYLMLINSL